MTVIKGCEGVYLRLNNLDYTICNEEKLDSFNNGDKVEAKFIKDDDCRSSRYYCQMVHNYETAIGSFRVLEIK